MSDGIKQLKTFGQILDAIIERGKLKTDDTTRDVLKEKVNTLQQRIGYSKPYRWAIEKLPFTFKAKYTTGTATFTNASDTVTGASTVWTSAMEGRKIYRVGDNTIYKILRVNSSTSITMNPEYVGTTSSAASYVIFQDEYGLFPDLQDLRTITIPNRRRPLTEIGPREMEERRMMQNLRAGIPEFITIDGLNYYHQKTWATFAIGTDYWEDDPDATPPRQKNLIIWPAIFETDIVATARYTKFIPQLGSETDEPIIPIENRYILVIGVLVDNFMKERDFVTKREWKAEYKEFLQMMAGDIETTDDELVMVVDRTRHRVLRNPDIVDEEYYFNES